MYVTHVHAKPIAQSAKDAGKMKSVRDAKSVRTKGIVAITGNIIVVIVMRKIVIAMNAIIIIKDVGVTDVIFSGI